MCKQVYTIAPWAIRCTPVHWALDYSSYCATLGTGLLWTLWAIRCTPVYYGQSGIHKCTNTSAPWAIRCIPVYHGQAGVQQCTMGNQDPESALIRKLDILQQAGGENFPSLHTPYWCTHFCNQKPSLFRGKQSKP